MYIKYTIDYLSHKMELDGTNISARGKDKESTFENLKEVINNTINEFKSILRVEPGNIVLKEITINADTTLIDAEQFKTIFDILIKQGRENGYTMFNQRPDSEQINYNFRSKGSE